MLFNSETMVWQRPKMFLSSWYCCAPFSPYQLWCKWRALVLRLFKPNKSSNPDKYILQYDKYILKFWQIHFEVLTNTFLKFWQKQGAINSDANEGLKFYGGLSRSCKIGTNLIGPEPQGLRISLVMLLLAPWWPPHLKNQNGEFLLDQSV